MTLQFNKQLNENSEGNMVHKKPIQIENQPYDEKVSVSSHESGKFEWSQSF